MKYMYASYTINMDIIYIKMYIIHTYIYNIYQVRSLSYCCCIVAQFSLEKKTVIIYMTLRLQSETALAWILEIFRICISYINVY